MTAPEWLTSNPQHIDQLSPNDRIKAFAVMQADAVSLYYRHADLRAQVLALEAAHEEGAATCQRLAAENEQLKLKLQEAMALALGSVT